MSETKRLKLSIIEVGQVQEIQGKTGAFSKLSFKAKNGDGKELSYAVFTKALFEAIKQGETIDAEVEPTSKEMPDGNTIINRNIKQIFKDGQPVAVKGRGWQQGGTPEQFK